MAARPRRRPSASSGCGSVARMPFGRGASGGSVRRVVCRTTSWFDSTQVAGAPTAALASSDSATAVRRSGARQRRAQEGEVERLVHLVLADVAREALGRLHPRLGHEHPGAVVLVEHAAPGAVDVVDAVLVPHRRALAVRAAALEQLLLVVPLGQPLGLHQAVGDVDAEAVDAPVEPVAQDVLELRAHVGVRPVEVGLLAVEQVQVPLAGCAVGLGHARPGAAAEDAAPGVRRQLARRAATVAEQVAGPLRAARAGGQRRAEPRVLVGGVVRDEVHEHPQAERVRLLDEVLGVGGAAEQRVDLAVVGDVVAGVGHGGAVDRRQPQGVHPERRQVRQPGGHAGEVTDAVAVGVGERPRVDLVDHRRAPPGLLGAGRRGARRGGDGGHAAMMGPCKACKQVPLHRPPGRTVRPAGTPMLPRRRRLCRSGVQQPFSVPAGRVTDAKILAARALQDCKEAVTCAASHAGSCTAGPQPRP